MAIDASIPLQVQQVKIPTALEMMSLRDLSTRNQVNQLTLQEKQTELQNRNMLMEYMRSPEALDPQTGRLTPQAISKITQIDPKMGMSLGQQMQQLSLQDVAVNEKRDTVRKRIGTAYYTAYQNHLQRTGGNTQEAERLARSETLEAIRSEEESGSLTAQGLPRADIEKLKQLPPPEQMRTIVTALGGDLKKDEPSPPKSSETRTLNFKGPGDVTYQKQQEWDQNTRKWVDIPGTSVPRHRDVAPLDEKRVQQLSVALEKANISESIAVLQEVENQLKSVPQLADWLTGVKSKVPDLMAPKEVLSGRQAFQKLFNITLKDRSGAAVTIPELERLKKEFASGLWNRPEQIEDGLRQAHNVIVRHYKSIAAGFGPNALKQFNENLQEIGGSPLDLEERPAKDKATVEKYPDPEKERRYQEWKSKQK